jgi:hypothetical protein
MTVRVFRRFVDEPFSIHTPKPMTMTPPTTAPVDYGKLPRHVDAPLRRNHSFFMSLCIFIYNILYLDLIYIYYGRLYYIILIFI